MKVICSGVSKTGTKTLCKALRILGYTVYDLEEQFTELGSELLRACDEGCGVDEFRAMFRNVDAVTDVPACVFWEELHEAFPDAKIVHTERETVDEWYASYEKQMWKGKQNRLFMLLLWITPTGRSFYRYVAATFRRLQFSLPYKPPYTNVKTINAMLPKLRYRQHNARVHQAAPKGKTLFFNLKDGWKPLCEFLDVPVPAQPFPHRNKNGKIIDEFLKESPLFRRIQNELKMLVMCAVVALSIAVFVLI